MACGCTLGDASRRFPTLERVLATYIAGELRAQRPFWISPELNSDTLSAVRPDDLLQMWPGAGLGLFPALAAVFSAVVSTASAVGSAVVAAAPSIATIAGSAAAIKTAGAANKALAAQNTQIPLAVQVPAIGAVQQDAAGGMFSTTTLLLIAGGALLLFTMAGR